MSLAKHLIFLCMLDTPISGLGALWSMTMQNLDLSNTAFRPSFLKLSIMMELVPSWPKEKSTSQMAMSPAFRSCPECALNIFSAMVLPMGQPLLYPRLDPVEPLLYIFHARRKTEADEIVVYERLARHYRYLSLVQ